MGVPYIDNEVPDIRDLPNVTLHNTKVNTLETLGSLTAGDTTVTSLTSSGAISGGDTTVTSLSTAIAGAYGYGSITGGATTVTSLTTDGWKMGNTSTTPYMSGSWAILSSPVLYDTTSGGSFALAQSTSGYTKLNCATNANVELAVNNASKLVVTNASTTSYNEVICSNLNCARGTWNGTLRFCGVSGYTNHNRIYGYASGDHWYQDFYVWNNIMFRIYRTYNNKYCVSFGPMYATSHPISSDDRLKHNEVDVSNALSTIRKLNAQKYQKTTEPKEADFNGELTEDYVEETGFIAQEVMKIPELAYLVSDGQTSAGKDIYYLNYNDIFVVNVQAVKELDAIVQSQQTKIDSLEARLTALESRNES